MIFKQLTETVFQLYNYSSNFPNQRLDFANNFYIMQVDASFFSKD